MITRGTIIGKIIDDLAKLLSQIELRNKVGLLDLTKVSEDFFKELLNIVYDLNLSNLNDERVNEPGIDLGDIAQGIAFQITSTKTSEKINNTLQKLTDKQVQEFSIVKVFIIGTKQSTYTIKTSLLKKVKFNVDDDVRDINDIIRDISTLDLNRLETLFTFFKRSFRELIIELEPMDIDGNFESSIYNYVEQIPNNPPRNVKRIDVFSDHQYDINDFVEVYHKLASIPKNQREYVSLIAERGYLNDTASSSRHEIPCTKLAGLLGMEEKELFRKMAYLEEENLVHFSNDTDEYDRPNYKYQLIGEFLNLIITYLQENKLPIRKTIVAMDFKVLEADE